VHPSLFDVLTPEQQRSLREISGAPAHLSDDPVWPAAADRDPDGEGRFTAVDDAMQQRPLVGEPLALDLVDTLWDGGDQLADPDGVAAWLAGHGYLVGSVEALVEARTALRAALERGERDGLNAVLARGTRTPVLRAGGPGEDVAVDPLWRPAWDAAVDYLRLLRDRPDRIRTCARPSCVLWFHDVSRNGTRRWCAMEVCGNRAKAGRYYERSRAR
jgi:predicted RNA-binding Zn ribbon-like protein